MKEWSIRIGCVLLGVALTLGTMHLKGMINKSDVSTAQEVETEKDAKKMIEFLKENK